MAQIWADRQEIVFHFPILSQKGDPFLRQNHFYDKEKTEITLFISLFSTFVALRINISKNFNTTFMKNSVLLGNKHVSRFIGRILSMLLLVSVAIPQAQGFDWGDKNSPQWNVVKSTGGVNGFYLWDDMSADSPSMIKSTIITPDKPYIDFEYVYWINDSEDDMLQSNDLSLVYGEGKTLKLTSTQGCVSPTTGNERSAYLPLNAQYAWCNMESNVYSGNFWIHRMRLYLSTEVLEKYKDITGLRMTGKWTFGDDCGNGKTALSSGCAHYAQVLATLDVKRNDLGYPQGKYLRQPNGTILFSVNNVPNVGSISSTTYEKSKQIVYYFSKDGKTWGSNSDTRIVLLSGETSGQNTYSIDKGVHEEAMVYGKVAFERQYTNNKWQCITDKHDTITIPIIPYPTQLALSNYEQ